MRTEEGNKALVRRWCDEAINRQNIAVADEIIAADFAINGRPIGRAGLVQAARWVRSIFSDLHVMVDDMLAEGDRVATRWVGRGTHRNEFFGIPATGKPIVLRGIWIDRIANGMIAERWECADVYGVLQQLGARPERN